MKKKVRLMLGLTILAWATQTLLAQLGYGQEVPAGEGVADIVVSEETFAKQSHSTPAVASGTLELRSEARIVGEEVRLRQVCRWPIASEGLFVPLGDLVVTRMSKGEPFSAVTVAQVRGALQEAGINIAHVRFSGPTSCTVSRGDVERNERDALEQWARASQGVPAAETAVAEAPAQETQLSEQKPQEKQVVRSLRTILTEDLASRLNLPAKDIQMSFSPRDEKILRLAEPAFSFDVQPRRVKNLGSVNWEVTVTSGETSQKVQIAAGARAWQKQTIVNRPLAYRQLIQKDDLTERRTLISLLPTDPLLTSDQIVGQQAARDLQAGTVVTAKLVAPQPLVEKGQFITVTLSRGGIKVKTVVRAMESGSFGQAVRAKNEATKEIYEVVLTGKQEGTIGPAVPPGGDLATTGNQ